MKIQRFKGGIMDTYSSSTVYSSSDLGPGFFIGYLLFIVAIYVVFSYFMGRVFKKAGEEPWKAWVPVYNQWVMLELGGQKGYWAILALVPLVNIVSVVMTCIAAYYIGLSLQKEGWFVILYILAGPVWIIWLALDSSTWQGTPAASVPAVADAPQYQPPAPDPTPPQPVQAPQPPVSQPPVTEQPNQNQNPTPPTPPIAS
jgi:hypothetical protein